MDYLKSKISSIGALLGLIGLGSSILSLFNYNLRILMWVDMWGTTMGWIIRVALIIGGGALFLLFNKSSETEEE
ncbi:MAG: hypothetical protein ACI8ZM_000293 [Crocinitomix sp.]|jgi:hypothetical protein